MSMLQGTVKHPILKSQSDYFSETEARMSSRGEVPELSITKIPDLNKKIWGLRRGELTLVAARTSHGKSAFMNQIAWDLACGGKKVLYLSLEMDVPSLQERLFCNVFKIDNEQIYRGAFKREEEIRNKWMRFMGLLESGNLEYCDFLGKTWREVDSLITNLDPKPDVLILDHVNEIMSGNMRDRRTAVDDYLIHFRSILVANRIAGIMGAQINRTGQNDSNKEPKSYNLKETGKLEEAADLILLLHWEWKDDDRKDKNMFRV